MSLNFKDSLVANREAENTEDVNMPVEVSEGNDSHEVEPTSNRDEPQSGSLSFGDMTIAVRKFFYEAFGKLYYQYAYNNYSLVHSCWER
jgi:hypothetical protein